MNHCLLAIIIAFGSSYAAAGDDVYSWRDENGQVHFSNVGSIKGRVLSEEEEKNAYLQAKCRSEGRDCTGMSNNDIENIWVFEQLKKADRSEKSAVR